LVFVSSLEHGVPVGADPSIRRCFLGGSGISASLEG